MILGRHSRYQLHFQTFNQMLLQLIAGSIIEMLRETWLAFNIIYEFSYFVNFFLFWIFMYSQYFWGFILTSLQYVNARKHYPQLFLVWQKDTTQASAVFPILESLSNSSNQLQPEGPYHRDAKKEAKTMFSFERSKQFSSSALTSTKDIAQPSTSFATNELTPIET